MHVICGMRSAILFSDIPVYCWPFEQLGKVDSINLFIMLWRCSVYSRTGSQDMYLAIGLTNAVVNV